MCTRFYVEPDTEEIREIIAEVQRSQLSGKFIKAGNAILTSGEIRPTYDKEVWQTDCSMRPTSKCDNHAS